MGPLEKDSHRANRSGSSVEVWKQSGSRRWKEPFYPFPKQAMHTESRPHLEEERRKGHTNSFNKKVLFCRYIATILSIWVYVCHTPGLLVKNEKVQWRNLKPASLLSLHIGSGYLLQSHFIKSRIWILWSREDARRGGYITNLFWGEIIWMSTWGLLRGDFMTGQPNCWLGYKSITTKRVDWCSIHGLLFSHYDGGKIL